MLRTLIAFGLNDLKSVRRDSLLLGVILAPWLLVLFLRLAAPPVTDFLLAQYSFDLRPYNPLVLAFFLYLNIPLLFGVLSGFLMLDERDDDTLTALRVTPASLQGMVAYRLLIAFAFSSAYILLTTPLAGLVVINNLRAMVLPALTAALFAPVISLALVAFARNKLEGFALMKGIGVVLLGPLVSFFVEGTAQWLFGILPTFWPLRAFVAALDSEAFVGYAIVGIAYHLLLIAVLYHRYQSQFDSSS
jgi:fluoroquinolone transport system permease protein